MERLHVHYLRELVHRLRSGASQHQIAHDLGLARMTIQKYAQLAAVAGYLDASHPLPEAAELLARLGAPPPPPRTPSTVEPYRAQVEQLLAEGVEMMTIFDRINKLGYSGSYSSIRRFVQGAIVKRGGKYSVVIELGRDPLTGRRKQKWHSGYRTKRMPNAHAWTCSTASQMADMLSHHE